MKTFGIVVGTIGMLMCLCVCGVLAAGVHTGVIQANVNARVDPDWIPPALGGDPRSDATPTPMRLVDYYPPEEPQAGTGTGTITIGETVLKVPPMTAQFTASTFPLLFSERGQQVKVVGSVVVQADDYVELWDGQEWTVWTTSVSEYRALPEGDWWIRIRNISGASYVKFLEAVPVNP